MNFKILGLSRPPPFVYLTTMREACLVADTVDYQSTCYSQTENSRAKIRFPLGEIRKVHYIRVEVWNLTRVGNSRLII